MCVGGKCVYTGCHAGWGDCITTGTNVDGCETPLTTISNCGGCGNGCDTATSTPTACAGGVCVYTCKPGFGDCDGTGTDPHNLNGCETPINTTTNCGSCGAACDTTHSIGASCSSGPTCKYTGCKTGFADCNATTPDTDGCETSTTTTADCGGCGKACDTLKSTPTSCTGGTCIYTCMPNFFDCNKAGGDIDGCECAGNGCCGTGTSCQLAHSNGPASIGLGQTYYDCAPLGTPGVASTYSSTMGTEAAAASPENASIAVAPGTCAKDPLPACSGSCTCVGTPPTPTPASCVGTCSCFCSAGTPTDSDCVVGRKGTACALWCYSGPLTGRVTVDPTTCYCPCPGGSTWN